jgi:hypothetical protein
MFAWFPATLLALGFTIFVHILYFGLVVEVVVCLPSKYETLSSSSSSAKKEREKKRERERKRKEEKERERE